MASSEEDEGLDVAVYLDDVFPPGPIRGTPAREWVEAAVDRLTDALTFFRRSEPLLVKRPAVVVVITSIVGTVGSADRSLAASVSAGLRGTLVSVLQDMPALTGVFLVPGSVWSGDARSDPRRSEDLEPLGLHDDVVLRWSAAEVGRIARDDTVRRPGQLITVMHELVG
jgi:hypothetical protein